MKICFIQPRAYELFNPKVKTQFGGAEVQMYLHALQLAKKTEHQISFIVADYHQPEVEFFGNISVYKSINFNESLLQQIKAFYSTFKKADADIYLQMTLTRFSFIIALYCLFKRKKFVYLISHDNDLDGKILKTNWLFQKISLLVFIFSEKIIAQNKFQFDSLKKINISSRIIKSSLESTPLTTENKEYHLWIARAEKWKKPELFIHLAEKNPVEKFLMVCPPFAEVDKVYYEELKNKCCKISNLVLIDYYVDFNELDTYFSKAKLFINTSASEGFPTTFIHSAKNGVPIISASVNPDSILDTNQIGFYCHGNEEELQGNFELLITDSALYQQYSKNCLLYFDTYHNLSKNSAALLDYISA